ncbi:MAG TPA: helix-turn-helix transcriptional regulator [Pseudogracilibacillus sp.]|nr:helix-turn-helix transcriptional regulator [Pseudogracilibacillus sp.]
MQFGTVLRKMRKNAGFSQEEMAEELHIARSSISKLERDQLELRASDMINWCNVTNAQEVLIAFLLGIDGVSVMQGLLETGQIIAGTIQYLFM